MFSTDATTDISASSNRADRGSGDGVSVEFVSGEFVSDETAPRKKVSCGKVSDKIVIHSNV